LAEKITTNRKALARPLPIGGAMMGEVRQELCPMNPAARRNIMEIDTARAFLGRNHRAVLLTHRRDGSPQMSPVACAVDALGRLVVSTTHSAAKARNARRDPRVSICVFGEGFFGEWIQVDGTAEVIPLPAAMDGLVEYYRAVGGEHPDWDEYRQAMEAEGRVLIAVSMERAGPDRAS
jgi:PPOX class probable F420-dependent enzyme